METVSCSIGADHCGLVDIVEGSVAEAAEAAETAERDDAAADAASPTLCICRGHGAADCASAAGAAALSLASISAMPEPSVPMIDACA